MKRVIYRKNLRVFISIAVIDKTYKISVSFTSSISGIAFWGQET